MGLSRGPDSRPETAHYVLNQDSRQLLLHFYKGLSRGLESRLLAGDSLGSFGGLERSFIRLFVFFLFSLGGIKLVRLLILNS